MRMGDLRVVDVNKSRLLLEVANEGDSGRLASITGVSLEGEPKHSNTLN